MNYIFTIKNKLIFVVLSVFISSENLVYADAQSDKALFFDTLFLVDAHQQSAETLLQMGHQKKNSDIEGAIKLYEKSLEVDPNYEPAKSSLKGALHIKDVLLFSKGLPNSCQSRTGDFDQNLNCVQKYFVIDGRPINPMIIKDLSTWISDGGDQVVSIDLLDSQNSNKYYCEGYNLKKQGNYYSVEVEIPSEAKDHVSREIFYYDVEGITNNGVYIIQTAWNGGGSGTFYNLLFVRIRKDMGFSNLDNNKFTLDRPRILIEKLGEYALGDRVPATMIKVEGNTVTIETQQHLPPYEKGTKKITISLENR
ncbi:MAG: hypothetical protein H0X26_04380 [Alphaproteobacteria bacterium]|nr:hypothetical protein [Alphaproteobacteria bacterium]